jgi:arginine deiminase
MPFVPKELKLSYSLNCYESIRCSIPFSIRATNLIAIAPRKAIGYEGNARVKRALAENDVDLVEIEELELIRGFGGPRCMTLPILRD